MVEAALTLLLFLMLIFTSISFLLIAHDSMAIQYAADHNSRALSLIGNADISTIYDAIYADLNIWSVGSRVRHVVSNTNGVCVYRAIGATSCLNLTEKAIPGEILGIQIRGPGIFLFRFFGGLAIPIRATAIARIEY